MEERTNCTVTIRIEEDATKISLHILHSILSLFFHQSFLLPIPPIHKLYKYNGEFFVVQ
jgi:hypothetical protein